MFGQIDDTDSQYKQIEVSHVCLDLNINIPDKVYSQGSAFRECSLNSRQLVPDKRLTATSVFPPTEASKM